MDIELYSGSAKAIISTHGGYVTNLADESGDILFPKCTRRASDGSEKVRGGCHVCLPNFGPGGESDLAQHGFGRTSEWQVRNKSETRIELVLAGQGEYMGMESTLTYGLQDRALTMRLTLKNSGTSPLKVSPGFHPYFYTAGKVLTLDGETLADLAEFAGTKFADGSDRQIVIGERQLSLHSDELTTWAEWTDQLGKYFCVEPTQSGNAFLDDMARTDTLAAGETREYLFTIAW